MTNEEIEKRIQELRLNAPRVALEELKGKIVGVTYTMMPSGKAFVCEITWQNGFTTRGESAVVSKENFNRQLGEEISYQRAFDEIWKFEAYLLQEKLYQQAQQV